MSGFDFPNDPVEDEEFTPANGPTYQWKAPRWVTKRLPAATLDDAMVRIEALERELAHVKRRLSAAGIS